MEVFRNLEVSKHFIRGNTQFRLAETHFGLAVTHFRLVFFACPRQIVDESKELTKVSLGVIKSAVMEIPADKKKPLKTTVGANFARKIK